MDGDRRVFGTNEPTGRRQAWMKVGGPALWDFPGRAIEAIDEGEGRCGSCRIDRDSCCARERTGWGELVDAVGGTSGPGRSR